MALTKIINDENKSYRPVLTDKLVLDAKPTVNSFNAITSDAVARAVAGASGEIPAVEEGDNGKVLTAIYDDGGAAVEWADAPVSLPDMTDQDGKILGAVDVEGTMEAQWINPPESYPSVTGNAGKVLTVNSGATGVEWASTQLPEEKSLASTNNTISITEGATTVSIDVTNPLPASTSADEDKVLTVNAQGAAEWATAQSGPSYTAGDGIDIANNAVSAKLATGLNFESGSLSINESIGRVMPAYSSSAELFTLDPDMCAAIDGSGLTFTKDSSVGINGWVYWAIIPKSSATGIGIQDYLIFGNSVRLDTNPTITLLSSNINSGLSTITWATVKANPSNYCVACLKPDAHDVLQICSFYLTQNNASTGTIAYTKTFVNAISVTNPVPAFDTTTDLNKVLQVTANGLAWVSLT